MMKMGEQATEKSTQQRGMNLVRRARWRVNPRPVPEERRRLGVISHTVAFCELKEVDVNQTHVRVFGKNERIHSQLV